MSDSILTSVKKILGLAEDYTIYDLDITMHINSALATLTQLGIGPQDGFAIEDATSTWDDFLATTTSPIQLNPVKTYVCLRVRLIFDPPATSFAIDSFQKQINELEWRLNIVRETTDWTDPDPEVVEDWEQVILDGGGP